MKEYIENSEVIDRMYNERSESFENCVSEILLENEKDLNETIEDKLKEKFSESEVFEILNNIDLLCNANCKTYYKMGIIDGLKFSQEVKAMSEKMNISK